MKRSNLVDMAVKECAAMNRTPRIKTWGVLFLDGVASYEHSCEIAAALERHETSPLRDATIYAVMAAYKWQAAWDAADVKEAERHAVAALRLLGRIDPDVNF